MAATQGNGLNRGVTDTTGYDSSTGSNEIRRDIDQTRTLMDRTIDELGARLSPRNLFDDLMCSVRDSIFGGRSTHSRSSAEVSDQLSAVTSRAGRGIAEAIRENPVPAALMGAGLAWFLFEDKAERQYRRMRHDRNQRGYTGDRWNDPGTHSGSFVDARTGEPYESDYGEGYQDLNFDGEPDTRPAGLKDKAAGAAHAVGSAAHGVADVARKSAQAAKNLASKTGHAASSARDRASEFGHSTGDSMRRAGESMRDYRRRTRESARHYGNVMSDRLGRGYDRTCERYERAMNDNPLAVGVAALAAGLLAGFAIPRTRMEDEMYGHTSHRLKEEARRRAAEAAEQGKEIASHVAGSALSEAEGQGLTPGSLGDKFARVAKDAMHAAKESAEREGVDPTSLGQKARFAGQAARETGREEIRRKAHETDGAEMSVGSATSSASSSASMGSLSDSADMSSVKHDAERSHDVAEGMSHSSESNPSASTAANPSDDSCPR